MLLECVSHSMAATQTLFLQHRNESDSSESVTYNLRIDDPLNGKEIRVLYQHNESDIDFIPTEIFTVFPNMTKFIMAGTYFRFGSLKEFAFDDFVGAVNLEMLVLNANKVTAIIRSKPDTNLKKSAETSQPLGELKELWMNANSISAIEPNVFNGCDSLIKLSLTDNRLTVLRRPMFAGLTALGTLHLERNQIETIEDGALDLPSLDFLGLDANKLKSLSDQVFDQLPKVTIIRLQVNGLERIGKAFYNLSTIEQIFLESNDIRDVNMTAFHLLPNLKKLKL